ncbi:restriction endonuclease [Thermosporothrix hazakensis]|uniref:Restriction endonuclease n=1 Tax=Thermosporothrix hazakensis TaxID=644383 RepID=A0A326U9I1_THEHA|nr:restriction endonuclease [Thermosporothrix hazakensis]PZW32690.1 restriction endonuclease [Thermosporothrix hazakensis]GCE50045.1 hypothetical protein KTH_49140 [Thermosporothrix hazakensis]
MKKQLLTYGVVFLSLVLVLLIVLGWSSFSPLLQCLFLPLGFLLVAFALILLFHPKVLTVPLRRSVKRSTRRVSPRPAPAPPPASQNGHTSEIPRTLQDVYRLKPEEFELFSAALVIAQGEHRFLEHCGKTGDHGVDTRLLNQFNDLVIVQSKRYAPNKKVQESEVRDFLGATYDNRAVYGYFVTTSTFTKPARQWIYKHTARIRTIDAPVIEALLQQKRPQIIQALQEIKQQQKL